MAASTNLTPSERALRARLASLSSWANTEDPTARTAPARAALMERFEREVDPDGVLEPKERARRAEAARRAWYASLSLKSATARRKAAQARVEADAVDTVASAIGLEVQPDGDDD